MKNPEIKERNRRPYSNLDWSAIHQLQGATHAHCSTDEDFQALMQQGMRFATLANYYPSAPYYPAASICKNTFRISQKGFVENGKYRDEEIFFKELISQWQGDVEDGLFDTLPDTPGEKLFSGIPEDLLEAPNAEHHSFSDITPHLHICAPGSALVTGHFDRLRKFRLDAHGIQTGFQLPWREAFQMLLDHLITPDGGGITINHPHWSYLPPEMLEMLLDFDPRVLGIEVYNANCDDSYSGSSEVEWDHLLRTGRQCFGFFTQDHLPKSRIWRGRNILLVNELSAEACLRAYREGNFYGAVTGDGLRFEYIDFDGTTLNARADRQVFWQMITKQGISSEGKSQEFSYTLKKGEKEKFTFLRLTARVPHEPEKLFTQPFMLDL